MSYVLYGLAAVAAVILLIRWLATTSPAKAYPVLVSLAMALVGLAILMAVSGRIAATIPFLMGAWAAYNRFRLIQGLWRQTTGKSTRTPGPQGKMGRDEAYDILGLKPGASQEEIQVAYKKLIQVLHPDKEGNDYLAGKVNQARDTLLEKK